MEARKRWKHVSLEAIGRRRNIGREKEASIILPFLASIASIEDKRIRSGWATGKRSWKRGGKRNGSVESALHLPSPFNARKFMIRCLRLLQSVPRPSSHGVLPGHYGYEGKAECHTNNLDELQKHEQAILAHPNSLTPHPINLATSPSRNS
jgi:hypothetical protein